LGALAGLAQGMDFGVGCAGLAVEALTYQCPLAIEDDATH
jgi:hypothetical protein